MSKLVPVKPVLNKEEGTVSVKAGIGFDGNQDGQASVQMNVEVVVDIKEGTEELFNGEVLPAWLQLILSNKGYAKA